MLVSPYCSSFLNLNLSQWACLLVPKLIRSVYSVLSYSMYLVSFLLTTILVNSILNPFYLSLLLSLAFGWRLNKGRCWYGFPCLLSQWSYTPSASLYLSHIVPPAPSMLSISNHVVQVSRLVPNLFFMRSVSVRWHS